MNKVLITALLAGGLLLLDAPEAAAHKRGHDQQRYSDRAYSRSYDRDYYYRGESRYQRSHKMPRWLKRDRSFRHWYKHTRLRRDRHISWNRLFDIYRWEHSYYRYRRH